MHRLLVMLVGLAALGGATPAAQVEVRTRSFYVSVIDDKGQAVLDLAAPEFTIKEDGKPRPVSHLVASTESLSVAILVDDGGVGMNDFRIAIAGLMNRLLDRAGFSLIGIAEQNRTVVDYTRQNLVLANGIRALIPRNVNGGGHLVEAVLDTANVMVRRELPRPVIVIVTNQGREYGDIPAQRAMDEVTRAGAAIYVAEVLRPSGQARAITERYDTMAGAGQANEQASADRARNAILGDGPKQTGGRREELISTADVPKAPAGIAEELAGQYVLTFETAAKIGVSTRVDVATTRRGVRVRAPARATDRTVR